SASPVVIVPGEHDAILGPILDKPEGARPNWMQAHRGLPAPLKGFLAEHDPSAHVVAGDSREEERIRCFEGYLDGVIVDDADRRDVGVIGGPHRLLRVPVAVQSELDVSGREGTKLLMEDRALAKVEGVFLPIVRDLPSFSELRLEVRRDLPGRVIDEAF